MVLQALVLNSLYVVDSSVVATGLGVLVLLGLKRSRKKTKLGQSTVSQSS